MPLPVGTWTIFTFGSAGAKQGALTLFSSGSTPAGSLTIAGATHPLSVLWNEGAQQVTFTTATVPGSGPVPPFEVYQGWAFQPYPTTLPPVVFAGTFQLYSPTGPAAPLSEFAWYAIAAPKPKEKEKEKEKEHKDKEKEHKDKEHKEFKELEKHPVDKLPEFQFGSGGEDQPSLQMLEQRVAVLEQRLATGQSFIRPEERPRVGESAVKPPAKDKGNG
jgi:hypothetical protein